jgi:site-specific DNA recombinase
VDILVREAVLSALDGSRMSKLLPDDAGQTVKLLLQRYQRLQRRMRDLVEDYAAGRLTRAELAHAKMVVERQIEHVQAQLVELQPAHALQLVPAGETIRDVWEKGSFAWRRAVLALLIERVVIRPAPPTYTNYHGYRFSPESVAVIWKSDRPQGLQQTHFDGAQARLG